MYGPATSASPLGPIVATASPSATDAPFATAIDPSCVSVTDQPSEVRIVNDFPLPGTVPANVTTPAAGARTTDPVSPPISIPRCSPAEYGWAGSNENASSTGPPVGQVHAAAGATATSAAVTRARLSRNRNRRIGNHLSAVLSACPPVRSSARPRRVRPRTIEQAAAVVSCANVCSQHHRQSAGRCQYWLQSCHKDER
jgi:hypothetical protein